MSFADWKKKSKLLKAIHWAHQDEAEVACRAAFKAGEREGRKQIAKNFAVLNNHDARPKTVCIGDKLN